MSEDIKTYETPLGELTGAVICSLMDPAVNATVQALLGCRFDWRDSEWRDAFMCIAITGSAAYSFYEASRTQNIDNAPWVHIQNYTCGLENRIRDIFDSIPQAIDFIDTSYSLDEYDFVEEPLTIAPIPASPPKLVSDSAMLALLRQERDRLGSNKALADKIGVDPSYVSNVLNGKYKIPERFGNALGYVHKVTVESGWLAVRSVTHD